MKKTCEIVKARGKDLEPFDVIRLPLGTYGKTAWREIMDIAREWQDLDAFYADGWQDKSWLKYLAELADKAFSNSTGAYCLARVMMQEASTDGVIEDRWVLLYDYDLYDVQSLSARE